MSLLCTIQWFYFPIAAICISLLFSVPYSIRQRSCWQVRNHLGSQTEVITLSPGTNTTVWCCWLPKAEDLGWAATLQTTIEHPWHGAEHSQCMTPPCLVRWSSINGYYMRYMIYIYDMHVSQCIDGCLRITPPPHTEQLDQPAPLSKSTSHFSAREGRAGLSHKQTRPCRCCRSCF